jgi:hypothetical protein
MVMEFGWVLRVWDGFVIIIIEMESCCYTTPPTVGRFKGGRPGKTVD